ncbi:cell cycle checkpoint control protein RAD9A isoform X2 [Eurytemora carolleeae]|uniref:cell cycle checkpoint control protein RAD9A isoform X2 n=1 Tax=Eurytemora carolleeae TaxID=1294199 RepID=UPI000C76D671|nr:cell cycle checkpoint control protein RAD9A isoform X2 [Eurytemora carolleeae]|eukprot:XP_023329229.1 cell cycle checkpoint control protein RAD9A-like isoform X2 [Eurytemora affinis]
MRYIIPKSNIKVFHKAIQALGKVGEELYFEPGPDTLFIKALNSGKSGFFIFSFHSSFFSSIEGQINGESRTEPFRCKVQLKSLLLAFNSVFVTEKSVNAGLLEFNQDNYKLLIERHCRYEVEARYVLPTMEQDSLKFEFAQRGKSSWCIQSKVLSDVVRAFLSSQDEATMTVTEERFHMKNYVDTYEDKEQTHTDFSMFPREFEEYNVLEEAALTFSLRDLRSIIGFAEATALPVKATFSQGGHPITFSVRQDPVLEVSYALSTLPDNDELKSIQTTRQTQGSQAKRRSNVEQNTSFIGGRQQRHSTQRDNVQSTVCPTPPLMTPIPMNGHNDTTERVQFSESFHELRSEDCGDGVEVSKSPGAPEDLVPQSPVVPRDQGLKRKERKVLRKCFEATCYPAKTNVERKILAEESDSDS